MNHRLATSACAHFAAAALALALPGAAFAQAANNDPAAELKAAFAAARQVMVSGGTDVPLLDQAVLKLPEGHVFVPKAEAARLMSAMGNRPGNDLLGVVFPKGDNASWFVVVRFVKEGYIKDDDAKNWNAKELLDSLKEGTEAANAERRKRGISEIEVLGWVEAPAYDAAAHRLVWSLSSKEKGAPESEEQGVNYNTYALGRDGYFSMNLVTGMNSIRADKPTAQRLLAALEYKPGKSYADFNAGTDHVAEYGLAALVGGVAAKKLGLFAVIFAFLAKFAKVIALGALALGASAFKLFRRSKPAEGATPPQA